MDKTIKIRAWNREKKIMYHNVGLDSEDCSPRRLYADSIDQLEFVAVNDCELMLYTRIKDKNDVLIYEDDIVDSSICGHMKVVWWLDSYWGDTGRDYYKIKRGDAIEVIGNIFENPELLKEDE